MSFPYEPARSLRRSSRLALAELQELDEQRRVRLQPLPTLSPATHHRYSTTRALAQLAPFQQPHAHSANRELDVASPAHSPSRELDLTSPFVTAEADSAHHEMGVDIAPSPNIAKDELCTYWPELTSVLPLPNLLATKEAAVKCVSQLFCSSFLDVSSVSSITPLSQFSERCELDVESTKSARCLSEPLLPPLQRRIVELPHVERLPIANAPAAKMTLPLLTKCEFKHHQNSLLSEAIEPIEVEELIDDPRDPVRMPVPLFSVFEDEESRKQDILLDVFHKCLSSVIAIQDVAPVEKQQNQIQDLEFLRKEISGGVLKTEASEQESLDHPNVATVIEEAEENDLDTVEAGLSISFLTVPVFTDHREDNLLPLLEYINMAEEEQHFDISRMSSLRRRLLLSLQLHDARSPMLQPIPEMLENAELLGGRRARNERFHQLTCSLDRELMSDSRLMQFTNSGAELKKARTLHEELCSSLLDSQQPSQLSSAEQSSHDSLIDDGGCDVEGVIGANFSSSSSCGSGDGCDRGGDERSRARVLASCAAAVTELERPVRSLYFTALARAKTQLELAVSGASSAFLRPAKNEQDLQDFIELVSRKTGPRPSARASADLVSTVQVEANEAMQQAMELIQYGIEAALPRLRHRHCFDVSSTSAADCERMLARLGKQKRQQQRAGAAAHDVQEDIAAVLMFAMLREALQNLEVSGLLAAFYFLSCMLGDERVQNALSALPPLVRRLAYVQDTFGNFERAVHNHEIEDHAKLLVLLDLINKQQESTTVSSNKTLVLVRRRLLLPVLDSWLLRHLPRKLGFQVVLDDDETRELDGVDVLVHANIETVIASHSFSWSEFAFIILYDDEGSGVDFSSASPLLRDLQHSGRIRFVRLQTHFPAEMPPPPAAAASAVDERVVWANAATPTPFVAEARRLAGVEVRSFEDASVVDFLLDAQTAVVVRPLSELVRSRAPVRQLCEPLLLALATLAASCSFVHVLLVHDESETEELSLYASGRFQHVQIALQSALARSRFPVAASLSVLLRLDELGDYIEHELLQRCAPMPPSLVGAERSDALQFLAAFPSLNVCSAAILLSSGLSLAELLSVPVDELIRCFPHIRRQSLLSFSSLCRCRFEGAHLMLCHTNDNYEDEEPSRKRARLEQG